MGTLPLEKYNTTPNIAPTNGPYTLSRHPVWLEACEKLGYHPLEWQSYHPPAFDKEAHDMRMEEYEAEQAVFRAEYETALSWVVSVARYSPDKIREALDLRDCAGPCNCECCYV